RRPWRSLASARTDFSIVVLAPCSNTHLLCRNPQLAGRIMEYEDNTPDDQIAAAAGRDGSRYGPAGAPPVLLQLLPQPLYPAPTLRPAGAARVPQAGLPRPRTTAPRLVRLASGPAPGQGPRPLHPPEGRPTPSGKKGVETLLRHTVAQAQDRGLIPPKPRAA